PNDTFLPVRVCATLPLYVYLPVAASPGVLDPTRSLIWCYFLIQSTIEHLCLPPSYATPDEASKVDYHCPLAATSLQNSPTQSKAMDMLPHATTHETQPQPMAKPAE